MIFFYSVHHRDLQISNSENFGNFQIFWNFWSRWKAKIFLITKIIKVCILHSERTFGAFSDAFLLVSDRFKYGVLLRKIRKFLIQPKWCFLHYNSFLRARNLHQRFCFRTPIGVKFDGGSEFRINFKNNSQLPCEN